MDMKELNLKKSYIHPRVQTHRAAREFKGAYRCHMTRHGKVGSGVRGMWSRAWTEQVLNAEHWTNDETLKQRLIFAAEEIFMEGCRQYGQIGQSLRGWVPTGDIYIAPDIVPRDDGRQQTLLTTRPLITDS
jgi:hypothetical protein